MWSFPGSYTNRGSGTQLASSDIGTADGIRTHDLQSRSYEKGVFHRFLSSENPLKTLTFSVSPSFIVVHQNSTFCIVVEFLLNSNLLFIVPLYGLINRPICPECRAIRNC